MRGMVCSPASPQIQARRKQAMAIIGKPIIAENMKSEMARLMTNMFDGVFNDAVLWEELTMIQVNVNDVESSESTSTPP